ncbi:MAG: prolipoprotein diacylglyceryl transferase [Candidatus Nanoarchaeia archaeon]|nr:prolipoprotein diacylglyceryl transferase [Candidatus Nanoarchaeia archaeon]
MVFYHNLNPVLFSVAGFEIRYYGMIIVLSLLIAYFMLPLLAKKQKINLSKAQIEDLILYAAISALIGARLFIVLFYHPSFYLSNPLEILKIWKGGVSFHGALVFGLAAVYYFCRKHKLKFLEVIDLMIIPTALGFALGRMGNFINGELYGRITSVPWAVKFQNAEGFRHPSQLYESAKNFLIFTTLFFLSKKKQKPGILLATFLIMYSILRFLIEFVREPELYIGFLTMGQFLNIFMFIAGILLLYKIKK